jgi:hypothetical protein
VKASSSDISLQTSERSRRKFTIAASITLAVLMFDMITGSSYDVLREELATPLGILLFAATVAALYIAGQYVLMGFVKQASEGLRTRSVSFNAIYVATITSQYVIIAILILLVAQIATGSYYDIRLVVAGMALSTMPAAVLLGWFSYRFLLWYRSNKRHVMILLLGIAEACSALAAAGNVISMATMMSEDGLQVGPQQQVRYHDLSPDLRVPFFLTIVFPTSLSFILRWGGIVLVIRNFSKKIGRLRFWIFVSVPLVVLMGGIYTVLLDPFAAHLTLYDPDMISSRIVGQIGAAVSFFLMGLAYYAVAKSIRKIDRTSAVIDYMLIAAFEVIMLPYSLSSPVIIYVAYPPFGAPAHFFLTAASYLLSLGIYSSAISVSQDMNLRHSIRKQAMDEPRLLGSIGEASMEDEVVRHVTRLAKEKSSTMTNETGIQPSITEAEIKQYLEWVIKQVKTGKNTGFGA